MAELQVLRGLVVVFAASVLGLYICHKVKLPPIVGFLLAGFGIGPSGLGIVSSLNEIQIMANIGVMLLLLVIGLEFSVQDLLKSSRAILLGGSLQVLLTIGIVYYVYLQFGGDPNKALFAGFLATNCSTAIAMRALQDRSETSSPHGRVILAINIFGDLIIVPMMIFTPLLTGVEADTSHALLIMLAKGAGVVAVVIVGARYIVPFVLERVVHTRSRELFLLSIALICMSIIWLTNVLGLSLGLGAFLAGLVISGSKYSVQALEGVSPFKIIFTGCFFVSIGMLLDTSVIAQYPLETIGGSFAIMVAKSAIAFLAALALGMSSRSAALVGLALGQVGEFSFILSKVGLDSGLLQPDFYKSFLAISILTMGLTPFVINVAPRIAETVSNLPGFRAFRGGSYRHLTKQQKLFESLKDHLVIIGYGVNGRNIARAARQAGIEYALVEMNPETVRQSQREGEPIIYGDAASGHTLDIVGASRARVVVVAISDPASTRAITASVREMNPTASLLVRTRYVSEVKALVELGADEVIPEEFETSVEIFTRVLAKYLVPRDEIEKFTSEVRAESYSMFRSIAAARPSVGELQPYLSGMEISAVRLNEGSRIVGSSLEELRLRSRHGVTVLAIVRDGSLQANPSGADKLLAGDILYVVGNREQCAQFSRSLLNGEV